MEFPGYVTYKSAVVGSAERGGTVVCIKNCFVNLVHSTDVSVGDQVWLKLRNLQDASIGFCYIPPSDSQYYSHASFAAIQERLLSSNVNKGFVIMGDMNCRFGGLVRDLPIRVLPESASTADLSYPVLCDDTNATNNNAEVLFNRCSENNLVVVNNLKTHDKHFVSNKTYKKRDTWISELDTCVASVNLLKYISAFNVLQRGDLPSDHAPIVLTISTFGSDLDNIMSRAESLGDHSVLHQSPSRPKLSKKPVKYHTIVRNIFVDNLLQCDLPVDDNVDVMADGVSEALYECARRSKGNQHDNSHSDSDLGRWERLLQDEDDSRVWKAIDWKGNVTAIDGVSESQPSDVEFKTHFETILNPTQPVTDYPVIETNVIIPILDDPITPQEVINQIQRSKPDKACGPDGLTPGVFSMLPAQWILTLVSLFNNIFFSGQYPTSWTRAKMFTIFKKGDRVNPSNYRGISVANAIAKLYDMVLCQRLYHWFTPFREQAGAQRQRGCLEHIITLRLLADTARRKKIKLFVAFIDFSKAYDLVPRHKLFEVLKQAGCGRVMLAALIAMYRVTENIIGAAVVTATQGVRQGLSTSCFLFTVFVNELIKRIKTMCQPEPFLSWVHILMLMDDTVLLSTTRAGIKYKLKVLYDFCEAFGMKINASKTKFFVINGEIGDRESLSVGDLVVEHCNSYVYLGSHFMCDGSVSSAVKEHAKVKICQVLKFVSFITKNNCVPFIVKRRVFDAALTSSLLYGCESWVCADIKPVIKLYHWAMKALLGVRKNTSNLVCYAELGYPTLLDLIQHKQHKFFHKLWQERSGMNDDPWFFVVKLMTTYKTPVAKSYTSMMM